MIITVYNLDYQIQNLLIVKYICSLQCANLSGAPGFALVALALFWCAMFCVQLIVFCSFLLNFNVFLQSIWYLVIIKAFLFKQETSTNDDNTAHWEKWNEKCWLPKNDIIGTVGRHYELQIGFVARTSYFVSYFYICFSYMIGCD